MKHAPKTPCAWAQMRSDQAVELAQQLAATTVRLQEASAQNRLLQEERKQGRLKWMAEVEEAKAAGETARGRVAEVEGQQEAAQKQLQTLQVSS